jgi:lysine 2,3-aminomutase
VPASIYTKPIVSDPLHTSPSYLEDPTSLTFRGAAKLGVPVEKFVNWRWQMRHQCQTLEDLQAYLALSPSEQEGLTESQALFRTGVTPYYAALIAQTDPALQEALRLQVIPRKEEMSDAIGVYDPLSEVDHSPVREVVHVYPDRVAFCVAMLCPVYCRYCYRKRRDEETGLHFNRQIIERGLAYIASQPSIRDVLITGGDPLIASDGAIEELLQGLRAIPHVEIIRIHSRTPVALPYRITKDLVEMIQRYHPVWVNTHFNSALELTPEAEYALQLLVNHGIPVGNQSVFLRGVNDTVEKMHDLCRTLVRFRVRPYYLFHPHLVAGTAHLRPSVEKGLAIMKGLRGKISGLAIPTYVLDTPSGKVPLTHNHVLGREGKDLILEDLHGEIWREKGAW